VAGRELDPREIAAADLVTSMIGGRAVPKDVGDAPEKTVDFLIEDLPNLRTAALEVTSIADPRVVSQLQAAFGRTWSSPDLSQIWAVALSRSDPNQNITRLIKAMTPLLVMFEREGETKVEVDYSPRYQPKPAHISEEMHEARITMLDNGVSRAQVWNTPQQGKHGEILFMIREGVSSDPGLLNELVVDRAKKKVEKLRAMEANRASPVHLDGQHIPVGGTCVRDASATSSAVDPQRHRRCVARRAHRLAQPGSDLATATAWRVGSGRPTRGLHAETLIGERTSASSRRAVHPLWWTA
jgi:hypothetical protein